MLGNQAVTIYTNIRIVDVLLIISLKQTGQNYNLEFPGHLYQLASTWPIGNGLRKLKKLNF